MPTLSANSRFAIMLVFESFLRTFFLSLKVVVLHQCRIDSKFITMYNITMNLLNSQYSADKVRKEYQMYYVLSTAIYDEESPLPLAEAVEPEICQIFVRNIEIVEKKSHFSFRIHSSWLTLDYMPINNVSRARLCSQRLVDILALASVQQYVYPALLLDRETGESLSERYFLWLPEKVKNTIDWERSESYIDPSSGQKFLTKLVLTDVCEGMALPLFQPEGRASFLIHSQLRLQLEEAGIKGMAFAPLDAMYDLHKGVQKEAVERLLREYPEDVPAWHLLTDLLQFLLQYQKALDAAGHIVALQPDDAKGWFKQGHLFSLLGEKKEALKSIQQSLQLEHHTFAWVDYSQILLELGKQEEALAAAQQFVRIWGKHYISWQTLGNVYATIGRYEKALQAFEKASELGGDNFREFDVFQAKKGEVLYSLERYEEALAVYNHPILLRSQNQLVWEGKIKVLQALDYKRALEDADEILRQLKVKAEKNIKARPH
jgi:tetratricopeptide (TPR) repeat protein